MLNDHLTADQKKAVLALASEFSPTRNPDIRMRQGRNWYSYWESKVKDAVLVKTLAALDDARELLAHDLLPEALQNCEAMQEFIGFADSEATNDWSEAYDTAIADQIFEGFIAAAQSKVVGLRTSS